MRPLLAALGFLAVSSYGLHPALAEEPPVANRFGPGPAWYQVSAHKAARVGHRYSRHARKGRPVRYARHHPTASFTHKNNKPISRPFSGTINIVETPPAPDQPIALIPAVVERVNLFMNYVASLLRPVGNCREWETVDLRVRTVVSDAAKEFKGEALLTSCYRSVAYNRAIYLARGKRPTNSEHSRHNALDFKITGVSPRRLAEYVRNHPLMKKIGGVGLYAWGVHADSAKWRNWGWKPATRYAANHGKAA